MANKYPNFREYHSHYYTEVSKRGVKCHDCRNYIRKDKTYFKYWFQRPGRPLQYRNICVSCFQITGEREVEILRKEIALTRKQYKISKTLTETYKKEDELICLSCKNRLKHIAEMCHPTRYHIDYTWTGRNKDQIQCKYQPIKKGV